MDQYQYVKDHKNFVVVWDPTGDYWEGAIVEAARVADLQTKGVALLPCCPELFSEVPFCGYAKRSWGSGWPIDSNVPRRVCPLALYSPGDPYRQLRWMVRLVGEKGRGIPMRLAAGEQRANVIRPSLSEVGGAATNMVDVPNLGDPDAAGGWTVGGHALLSMPGPGMFALSLYAANPGMRVAWVAATLTP